jgi:hypothetical protein
MEAESSVLYAQGNATGPTLSTFTNLASCPPHNRQEETTVGTLTGVLGYVHHTELKTRKQRKI